MLRQYGKDPGLLFSSTNPLLNGLAIPDMKDAFSEQKKEKATLSCGLFLVLRVRLGELLQLFLLSVR